MERIELTEVFFPGQYEFYSPDFHFSAWEAPSGKGYTLHASYKHFPYTSVVVRELPDIHAAEIAAAAYVESCMKRETKED